MSFKKDLRQLLKPYYWVNILLSISYIVSKRMPIVCKILFSNVDCELDDRETEILFFLVVVVMFRSRKTGSVSMINYLSASFVYTKIANLILWGFADVSYGLAYGAIVILCALLIPEPTYAGPEYVTYFRGPKTLDEELKRNKNIVWIVCLYAAWHPACVNFAPIFAELSARYTLENLKFGKLDVGRYPEAATKYRIQDGPTSRQLPTILMIMDGEEEIRRPDHDDSGKLRKFHFSKDNVRAAFDLDVLHEGCKQQLLVDKDNKKSKKTN